MKNEFLNIEHTTVVLLIFVMVVDNASSGVVDYLFVPS